MKFKTIFSENVANFGAAIYFELMDDMFIIIRLLTDTATNGWATRWYRQYIILILKSWVFE